MKELRIFFFSVSLFACIFFAASFLRFGYEPSKIYLVILCASLIVACMFRTYKTQTPKEAELLRRRNKFGGLWKD